MRLDIITPETKWGARGLLNIDLKPRVFSWLKKYMRMNNFWVIMRRDQSLSVILIATSRRKTKVPREDQEDQGCVGTCYT